MAAQAENRFLQKPLYIFDLPQELLYTLQLKVQSAILPTEPLPRTPQPDSPPLNGSDHDKQDGAPTSATSCGLCTLAFTTVQDQRSHVRSDLHSYNLKQKLRGKKPVTEPEFERLVNDLDESISGSDSSESSGSDEGLDGTKSKETTLSALLKRQAKVTDGSAEDAPTKRQRGSGKPPLLWFTSPKLPDNTNLGVYRTIFSEEQQAKEELLVDTLQKKQLAPKPAPSQQKVKDVIGEEGGVPLPRSMIQNGTSASGPHYFLCMIGGGHFAGMIVSLTPNLTKKAGVEDRSATVIAHKTFHRYTTRRKQGGSQSANDNSKGNAHSAGSSLRRYNEAALTQEVRDLLAEWKDLINSAELLFVRATGSTNRRTLFGPYDGQVLSHRDNRIRGFPFSTRRATQSELMRAFVELTRVKVTFVDEEALRKQAEAATTQAAKAEAASNGKSDSPKPPKRSKEVQEATLHTTQLQALIRRSKAPGVLSYLQSNNLSTDFRFSPAEQNHHAPTPLHLAAASNSPACISALLAKAGADPTALNDDGKTAFDIAGDRATRDAFRLARSRLGENKWNWTASNVPSALSQAEVDERAAREKADADAEAAAEGDRRKAEMERLRKEDAEKAATAREKKVGRGNVLGVGATAASQPMSAQERRMEDARGMTDEMRVRLERERRARAAEERMRRMQQGGS